MNKKFNRRHFIKGPVLGGIAGMVTTNSLSDIFLSEENQEKHSSGISSVAEIEKGKLRQQFSFNKDGKFKIVQFTDTHYIAGDIRSERALKNVNQVLDLEKPDLVIHTGDVIYGKPAERSMREILKPMSERKIPFSVTFGNHDDEFKRSREELYCLIRDMPYSVISSAKDIYGITNYALVLNSFDKKKISNIFYLFDSNAYSTINDVKGYGHIHFDQIDWYRKLSKAFAAKNSGEPVPSLAFFHIPIPEYAEAMNDKKRCIAKGNFKERVCCPMVNSGLYVSMREMGDVKAIFAGHDHNNDFAAYWNNMFFIYGRFSGCDTVYNDLKPNGARVIELTEGVEGFRSYIRLYGNEIVQDYNYPDDFVKE